MKNVLHFSHQIFLCIIKRPIQLEVQVPDRGQTVSLPLVFPEQEWTRSFMTGGFACVGLADNDD